MTISTADAERARRDAEQMFRTSDVPETFRFVEQLSPLNKRLFVIDLWEALSRVAIAGDDESLIDLLALIEDWEATAELDAATEVSKAVGTRRGFQALDLS